MLDGTASVTAKLCSFVRAYHCGHDRSRIFDDFLARDLIGDVEYREMQDLIQCELSHDCPAQPCGVHDTCPAVRYYLSPILLARVAFAEEQLQQFMAQHSPCQYVICGAGLDTFSMRNVDSGVRVFELDHPDTQGYKLDRIEHLGWGAGDSTTFVPIDFNVDSLEERLLEYGFDPGIPSFFALLGVTYYLKLDVFAETCRSIARLQSPGSVLCFDFPDLNGLTSGYSERIEKLASFTEKLGEPMSGGYQLADVVSVLHRAQMEIGSYMAPAKIQETYFDGAQAQLEAYEGIHFISTLKSADGLLHEEAR